MDVLKFKPIMSNEILRCPICHYPQRSQTALCAMCKYSTYDQYIKKELNHNVNDGGYLKERKCDNKNKLSYQYNDSFNQSWFCNMYKSH